jgi:hypothetical protein
MCADEYIVYTEVNALRVLHIFDHGRMVRGGHGLPKVLPSRLCKRTTPETALWLFQGWPVHRLGSLRPSSTLLDTLRHTPMFFTLISTRLTAMLADPRPRVEI